MHDTRSVGPDVPRLPAFDPHHVLFSAIPPKWAGSPEFLELYGDKLERLHETTYTIFLSEFSDKISSPVRGHYELRYFGHALHESDKKGELQPMGLRLRAPGHSYTEALGTVFVAANHILGLRDRLPQLSIDGMKIDPAHAIEKLRHHGFLLLRLDEFMKF
jgi:hypothetical protein